PHPGSIGGCAPPNPAVHFWTPKSEPKNRQNQWFWIPFPNRSVSDLGHFCTESGFCHLIYSGSIDDTSPAVRVGTSSASLILPQATGFARCAVPPSSSANAPLVCLGAAPPGPFYSHIGLPAIQGGIQRGRAPFVSSWGRGT